MRLDPPTYLLVQRCGNSSVRLVSESSDDGARVVFVFDEPVTAEAFLIIENLVEDLGLGWEVVEYPPPAAAELLEACADKGVEYVALNPPSALTRGYEEALLLIPIRGYIDHLLGR